MIENNEYVSLCSDTTFKYLFKDEYYKKWFTEFIMKIINVDLEDFYIYDNESNTGNLIKDYRMDIVLKHKYKKSVVIIEMNNYKDFNLNKSYQYLYRLAGNAYEVGDNYSDDITVKLIAFNNFIIDWLPKNVNIANFKMTTDLDNFKYSRKEIESFEIYLPRYKKMRYNTLKDYEIPLAMFNTKSFEEIKQIARSNLDFEIISELERLSMDNEFLIDYNNEKVFNKMINSAKYVGIEQAKIEVIKKMYDDNMSLELIAKYTDLSLEKVQEIIKKIK